MSSTNSSRSRTFHRSSSTPNPSARSPCARAAPAQAPRFDAQTAPSHLLPRVCPSIAHVARLGILMAFHRREPLLQLLEARAHAAHPSRPGRQHQPQKRPERNNRDADQDPEPIHLGLQICKALRYVVSHRRRLICHS